MTELDYAIGNLKANTITSLDFTSLDLRHNEIGDAGAVALVIGKMLLEGKSGGNGNIASRSLVVRDAWYVSLATARPLWRLGSFMLGLFYCPTLGEKPCTCSASF